MKSESVLIVSVVRRKENDVTVIEGVLKPSPNKDVLVSLTDGDPQKACSVCALESRGITIRHTVSVLKEIKSFVRDSGF